MRAKERRFELAAMLVAGILSVPNAVVADDVGFDEPSGYVLSVGSKRTVVGGQAGLVVGLPGDAQRRHPVEIVVEIVAPPLPSGLSRCAIWRRWPLCARSREQGVGSSGDALTLTVFQPLDDRFVRYRQTKHADGFEPRFELLDWLDAGELRVGRAP